MNQVNRYGMLFEQVAQLKDLSSNAKVVHAVLYQFQNPETGQCNPKQSLIARAAGLSIKVTHAAIAELKRWGLLRTSGTNRRLQYDLQPTPYRGLIKPEKEEKLSTTYPPQGVSHDVDNLKVTHHLPPTGGQSSEQPTPYRGLIPTPCRGLVPIIRTEKTKGKDSTPLTPQGVKETNQLLILQFPSPPGPCQTQKLKHYGFTYFPDEQEWRAPAAPVAHGYWTEVQEDFGDAVTATTLPLHP